jgi:hypothetical protein
MRIRFHFAEVTLDAELLDTPYRTQSASCVQRRKTTRWKSPICVEPVSCFLGKVMFGHRDRPAKWARKQKWLIAETKPKYTDAYEDAIAKTSTKHAPWYIISANHKWFRNLAVSQIKADTMDEMGLKLPPTHVDIADIRRLIHAAEAEENVGAKRRVKNAIKPR